MTTALIVLACIGTFWVGFFACCFIGVTTRKKDGGKALRDSFAMCVSRECLRRVAGDRNPTRGDFDQAAKMAYDWAEAALVWSKLADAGASPTPRRGGEREGE